MWRHKQELPEAFVVGVSVSAPLRAEQTMENPNSLRVRICSEYG